MHRMLLVPEPTKSWMRTFSLPAWSRCGASLFLTFTIATLTTHSQDFPEGPAAPGTNSSRATVFKKMTLEELMNQDVTSVTRAPAPFRDAPAAINVITSEQIRRSGAQSIPEALRLADNLDVAQISSGAWAISSRGFNASVGNKLLVLMDGRSVYTPLFSGVIWDMQDYLLEDIDRIEVISGPGGSLWGANAVNGVINIISKSAKDTQGLYLKAGAGTWLEDFGSVRYGATLSSNVYFRVFGKYADRGPEDFRDGTSAHDPWNRGMGGFRLDAEPSAQNLFTLEGTGSGENVHTMPGGEGLPTSEGTASDENIIGRWAHVFAEDKDLTLQFYYDRTHLAAPFQSSGVIPRGTLYEDLDTADLDFQDRLPIGPRDRFTWGMEYRHTHDNVNDAPLVAFLPNVLDQDLFSAFVQDEYILCAGVTLTAGAKIEHNDYTGLELEPSGRIRWDLAGNQMVWAAVSKAVRAPSRYDRDLLEPSPAYGVFLGTTNSGFRSENLVAYELGYRAQFGPRVTGSISGFYNDYNNLRSLSLSSGGALPLVFQNDLLGETYGFELGSDYQILNWWRWHAGYSLLKEHLHVKPGGTDLFKGLNETADPQQQVFLRSSMDLPYHTEFDADFRWIDRIHNNNGGTPGVVDAYPELDLRLGWHATDHLDFSIVGQNLLHDRHPESGFAGPAQEEIVRGVFGEVQFRW